MNVSCFIFRASTVGPMHGYDTTAFEYFLKVAINKRTLPTEDLGIDSILVLNGLSKNQSNIGLVSA